MNGRSPTGMPPASARRSSRRHFLGAGLAAVAAGVMAGGCRGSDAARRSTSTVPPTTSPLPTGADARIMTYAARLEVVAVTTYAVILEAATAGRLGPTVPPALAEFIMMAKAHHRAHLDVWNGALTAGGAKAQDEADVAFKRLVGRDMRRLRDVSAASRASMVVEQSMAGTYLAAVPRLADRTASSKAASMYAVDRQHLAVLQYISGLAPLPDVFAGSERALPLP